MKWLDVEIGKVADVVSGFGFPREYQGVTNEEYPFFKVGDMNLQGNERCMTTVVNTISSATLKELKAKAFPKGTVIFPKIGAAIATNKKRMLTQPSVVDNNIMGFIPTSHIYAWYLFYWMQQFDLRSVSNIGPVPSMRKTEVERVLIPLPPFSEQQRIVEILDQADTLRQKRVETDAKAERILPSLFYRMFGDPAINSKEWPFKRMGEVSRIVSGATPRTDKPEYWGGKIPWATPRDLSGLDDWILERTERSLTEEGFANCSTTMVPKGAVLLSSRAPIGLVAIAGVSICTNQGFKSLVCEAAVDSWYLFAWCKLNNKYIQSLGRGATFTEISKPIVESILLPIPPLAIQHKFRDRIQHLRNINQQRRIAQNRIEKTFKILLHHAFTGDLTSKWREAHMKELLAEMEIQAKAFTSRGDA